MNDTQPRTDKEKLVALLNEWGVHFENEFDSTKNHDRIFVGDTEPYSINATPKVTGYGGFYTSFDFDRDGTFIEMGAWE